MKTMETRIQVIADAAGISYEEAQQAYELAEGDIEKALDFVRYVEKSYFALHGKFVVGKASRLYGIFNLIGLGREGQPVDFGLAVSFSPKDVEALLTASPEVFKKIVAEAYKECDSSHVHGLLVAFYEHISTAQIYQIYQFIKEGKKEELHDYFKGIMGRIFGSTERIELELHHVLMSKVQCAKNGIIPRENEPVVEEGDGEPNLTIYLDTEPIISPGKGKTIDKFRLDEMIPVRITDKRDAGKYLGKMLANEYGVAFGQLKETYFHESTDRYWVTVEFGPKINGRFVIDPMVRLADSPDFNKDLPEVPGQRKPRFLLDNNTTIVLLVTVIILLVIFIVWTR